MAQNQPIHRSFELHRHQLRLTDQNIRPRQRPGGRLL